MSQPPLWKVCVTGGEEVLSESRDVAPQEKCIVDTMGLLSLILCCRHNANKWRDKDKTYTKSPTSHEQGHSEDSTLQTYRAF